MAAPALSLQPELSHTDSNCDGRWFTFTFYLIAASFAVRLAIASVSLGSNDAFLFVGFATEIRLSGLLGVYRMDSMFNHPPVIALWIQCAAYLANVLPHPLGWQQAFCFIFKLPVIAGDMLGAWLVYRIWKLRVGSNRAMTIAALAAWSLSAIALSSYHCNTDALYAVICLAAVYLMEERQSFFLAGLTLAAAINVKIVPVLLIAPLLLSCRSIADARLFFYGLLLGATPFIPVLCVAAPAFIHNVLAYNSNAADWGMMFILHLVDLVAGSNGASSPLMEAYHSAGRLFLFPTLLGWAIVARWLDRWNRYEAAAVTFGLFLVFTHGFGVQYVIIIGPMLFAIRPMLAFVYATASGVFVWALYITHHRVGAFPIYSRLSRFPFGQSLLGVVAWGILVGFVVTTLGRRRKSAGTLPSTGQAPAASYTSARAA
jgi:hypothetical protein